MKSKIPARVRQRDRIAQLKLLSRFEKSLAKKVTTIIGEQGKNLAASYKAHGSVSINDLAEHKHQFLTILSQHYKRVMQAFADRIRRSIKSNLFENVMAQWIATNGLSTIDDIDSTTLSIVKTVINNGVEDGLTRDAIALLIAQRTQQDVAYGRALVIARTEMHVAANFASMTAAEDTGLKLNKVWTSTLDGRTREAHQEADGQSVPIDQPFDVDGEDVDHPGDGSAENAVNCRCTMVYEEVSTDNEE